MDIVVNDTNILIDLHSVGLLDEVCRLPFEIHTVDFVIEEITDPDQRGELDKLIRDGKIHVCSFSGEEVSAIVLEHSSVAGNLSITDVAVCYYASQGSYKVITGDRQMRNYAASKQLEVHGILYIFDEMVGNNILEPGEAATKLIELRALNSRLPKSEMETRIRRWQLLGRDA